MTLERYGLTHEARPLVLAAVTSPENHARIEEIRRRHLAALTEGEDSGNAGAGTADSGTAGAGTADRPVVVWMGYSVHGNEPSGANASMLVGYHLAAGQGGEIEELPDALVERLRHYFATYKLRHGSPSTVSVERIYDRSHAQAVIEAARADYREVFGE